MSESVLTNDQLRCLASPARNDVLVALRAVGPASTKEVAARVGRSPEATHYHLKALFDVGLIQVVGRRPAPKKPETIYACVSTRLKLPTDSESRELRKKAVEASIRQALRGYLAAKASNANEKQIVRTTVRLSNDDRERFFALISEALAFAETHSKADAPLCSWLSLAYPSGD